MSLEPVSEIVQFCCVSGRLYASQGVYPVQFGQRVLFLLESRQFLLDLQLGQRPGNLERISLLEATTLLGCVHHFFEYLQFKSTDDHITLLLMSKFNQFVFSLQVVTQALQLPRMHFLKPFLVLVGPCPPLNHLFL